MAKLGCAMLVLKSFFHLDISTSQEHSYVWKKNDACVFDLGQFDLSVS